MPVPTPPPQPPGKVYWRFRYLIIGFVTVLSVEMCASAAPEPAPSNPSIEAETVPEAVEEAHSEVFGDIFSESEAAEDDLAETCSIPPPTAPPVETCDE